VLIVNQKLMVQSGPSCLPMTAVLCFINIAKVEVEVSIVLADTLNKSCIFFGFAPPLSCLRWYNDLCSYGMCHDTLMERSVQEAC
jgi:hypothetical protein